MVEPTGNPEINDYDPNHKKKQRQADHAAEKASRMIEFKPDPCWVQAFLIMLLHKNGGSETLSVEALQKFQALKGDNKTILNFDVVAQTVTITAPEMVLPDEPLIIHEKGLKLN